MVIGKDYDEILGNGHGVSAVPHDVPLVYMRDPRYITMLDFIVQCLFFIENYILWRSQREFFNGKPLQ
jgi:hypothetical protein